MLEIIYRVYEKIIIKKKRYDFNLDSNDNEEIDFQETVILNQDVIICDSRNHFKEIMKDIYDDDKLKFANRNLKIGDIYIQIISESCYNTEDYLAIKEYECNNCGNKKTFSKRLFQTTFWKHTTLKRMFYWNENHILKALESSKEYKHLKDSEMLTFCCYDCQKEMENKLNILMYEYFNTNELIPDSYLTRESFKEYQENKDCGNFYVYMISKKDTNEFYIGQTNAIPMFRWMQHLQTERFPVDKLTNYKFEILKDKIKSSNILNVEKEYIEKYINLLGKELCLNKTHNKGDKKNE